MLITAFELFTLKELPFSRFNFPRWQSVLTITLLGLLSGLDPHYVPMLLAVRLAFGVVTIWMIFQLCIQILRWWMKRDGRWDGQGDLFNLVTASEMVAGVLGAGLAALGLPFLILIPLYLYSVWVSANALANAIPKADLGYCFAGITIASVISLISLILVGLISGVVLVVLGYNSAPQ